MVRKHTDTKKIIRYYVRLVKKSMRVDRALIFGSYARGAQSDESDIDLLIVSRDFGGMPFLKRLEFLNRLRTGVALSVPMDIIGLTQNEFSSFKKNDSSQLRKIYHESKIV